MSDLVITSFFHINLSRLESTSILPPTSTISSILFNVLHSCAASLFRYLNCLRVTLLFDEFEKGLVLKRPGLDFATQSDMEGSDQLWTGKHTCQDVRSNFRA